MDAPDDQPPVPPPFMFACDMCTELLRNFGHQVRADAGCFTEQLLVAKHIAEEHPDAVPESHADECDLCPRYAGRPEDAQLWAEHRARDLFLPEPIARLM